MTFFDFIQLDTRGKLNVVLHHSVMVASRHENEYLFILYQLDSFYVEVKFHLDLQRIDRVNSFDVDDPLEPYISKIDLSEIAIQIN